MENRNCNKSPESIESIHQFFSKERRDLMAECDASPENPNNHDPRTEIMETLEKEVPNVDGTGTTTNTVNNDLKINAHLDANEYYLGKPPRD